MLLLQSYGLTESTGGLTMLGPADHMPAEKYEHRLRSAGRPMRGAKVRVVDPVTLADCPVGERGEVLVAGSRIMKGYWRCHLHRRPSADRLRQAAEAGDSLSPGHCLRLLAHPVRHTSREPVC